MFQCCFRKPLSLPLFFSFLEGEEKVRICAEKSLKYDKNMTPYYPEMSFNDLEMTLRLKKNFTTVSAMKKYSKDIKLCLQTLIILFFLMKNLFEAVKMTQNDLEMTFNVLQMTLRP